MDTPTTPTARPGWYPDSASGGHRFWDGTRWTADVLAAPAAPIPAAPAAPAASVAAAAAPAAAAPTATLLPPPGATARTAYAPQGAAVPVGAAASYAATPKGPGRRAGGLQVCLGGAAAVAVSGFVTWGTGAVNGVTTGSVQGIDGAGPWAMAGPSADALAEQLAYGASAGGVSDYWFVLACAIAAVVVVARLLTGRCGAAGARAVAILGGVGAAITAMEHGSFGSKASEVGRLLGADVSMSTGPGMYLCLAGCVAVVAGAVAHLRSARPR